MGLLAALNFGGDFHERGGQFPTLNQSDVFGRCPCHLGQRPNTSDWFSVGNCPPRSWKSPPKLSAARRPMRRARRPYSYLSTVYSDFVNCEKPRMISASLAVVKRLSPIRPSN